MKSTLIALLLFIAFSTNAQKKQQTVDAGYDTVARKMTDSTIVWVQMPLKMVKLFAQLLGDRPYNESAPIIDFLQAQVNAQSFEIKKKK